MCAARGSEDLIGMRSCTAGVSRWRNDNKKSGVSFKKCTRDSRENSRMRMPHAMYRGRYWLYSRSAVSGPVLIGEGSCSDS